MDGDVSDGLLANDEGGIVVFGSSVLDEEYGGRDADACWLKDGAGRFQFDGEVLDDVAVEESLQVVVAVVGNL